MCIMLRECRIAVTASPCITVEALGACFVWLMVNNLFRHSFPTRFASTYSKLLLFGICCLQTVKRHGCPVSGVHHRGGDKSDIE